MENNALPENSPAFPYVAEAPVELLVDGRRRAAFLCTPQDLEDLAVGHLVTSGMLASAGEITAVRLHTADGAAQIHLTTQNGAGEKRYAMPDSLPGHLSLDALFSRLPPVSSPRCVPMNALVALAQGLREGAAIHRRTGGVHCAGVHHHPAQPGGARCPVREDIGRHNAVDKAIGAALAQAAGLADAVLLTSGRVNLDTLLKAAAVGIPIVVSFKIPSDIGLMLAARLGIAVVGRALGEAPVVYTAPWRVTGE